MKRENTKRINVGGVAVGGGAKVSVQSMCNTKTWDAEATAAQIREFAAAGCDIVRVAVPDMRSAGDIGDKGAGGYAAGGGHPLRLPARP